MRVFIIFLLIIQFIAFPSESLATHEDDHSKWKAINETADQVLQLVKEEQYIEAKQLLAYFSEQFLATSYYDANLTMNDLRVVTMSFTKAEEAVTAASLSHVERVRSVTEFRLAIDALTTEYHPLWLNSETSLFTALAAMKEAVQQEDTKAYQHRLNEFITHYNMIRPALVIDLEPHQFQMIDSRIQFIERNRQARSDAGDKMEHLQGMEKDLRSVYQRFQEDGADPSLFWVMISVGGMIMLSLSYVGWKKYKAEKKKKKVKIKE